MPSSCKGANRPGDEPGEPRLGVSGSEGHRLYWPTRWPLRPLASLSVPLAGVHPGRALTHHGQHPFPDSGRAGLRRAASAMGGLSGQARGLACGSRSPVPGPPGPQLLSSPPRPPRRLTRAVGPASLGDAGSGETSSRRLCSLCSPGRCWSPCGTRAPSRPCSPRAG